MKNKKTFIIAVCTVAVMLATIVGLTLYSSSNRKNNIQKVVAEVNFIDENSFDITLRSNDNSKFWVKSLPVKMKITSVDGSTKTIENDIAENNYYFDKYKFLPMFYSYEDGIHVSGSAKEFDYYNNQYEEIKSVELEVNGQKSTFVNKKLNQIHYEDEQQN